MNDEPRDHLALALDVGDLDAAVAVAQRVQPWFGVAKVGFELYAEAGPAAFDALRDKGFRVFADLKLHDIPTTVGRAARALGRRGIDFLNFHAAGGVDMLRAGVEGLADGAREAGHARPLALAVTVLTSDPNVDARDERMRDGPRRTVRRCRVCGHGRRRRARARPAHDGSRHPARRRRRARPGAGRHARLTPSNAARTGSCSAAR